MLHARLAKRLDFCDDGQAPNNRLFDHWENLVSKQVGPILAVAIFLLYEVSNIRYSHKAICSTMFIIYIYIYIDTFFVFPWIMDFMTFYMGLCPKSRGAWGRNQNNHIYVDFLLDIELDFLPNNLQYVSMIYISRADDYDILAQLLN